MTTFFPSLEMGTLTGFTGDPASGRKKRLHFIKLQLSASCSDIWFYKELIVGSMTASSPGPTATKPPACHPHAWELVWILYAETLVGVVWLSVMAEHFQFEVFRVFGITGLLTTQSAPQYGSSQVAEPQIGISYIIFFFTCEHVCWIFV